MNPLWLQVAGKLALLAALAGVVRRNRVGSCVSFAVYLACVLAFETVVSLWPERFYVWWFWLIQQACFDAAKLAVAVELAWRAFRLFPGARATARWVFVSILALTTTSIIVITPGQGETVRSFYEAFSFEWEPRVLNGTIWLFVATARLVLWYRLPVSRWHRVISLGFGFYLVVFVTLTNLLGRLGWQVTPWTNVADGLAYLVLVSWWAYEAWRPDDERDWSRRFGELGLSPS